MDVPVKRSVLTLGLVALALVLIHSIVQFWETTEGAKQALHITFNLDREGNIPTVFSTLLLFIIGSLCYLSHRSISERKDKFWIILTFAFIFLAFDEGGQIHEKLNNPFRDALGGEDEAKGFLYFAWVIPYGLLILIVGGLLLKSFLKLHRKTRNFFLFSGTIYLFGAFGLELIGGKIASEAGNYSGVGYLWMVTLEETLELTGLIFFIYTVMDYLRRNTSSVDLEFT